MLMMLTMTWIKGTMGKEEIGRKKTRWNGPADEHLPRSQIGIFAVSHFSSNAALATPGYGWGHCSAESIGRPKWVSLKARLASTNMAGSQKKSTRAVLYAHT